MPLADQGSQMGDGHFGGECEGPIVTRNIIRPKNIGYGLYGYVITKEGVNKLFKNILPFAMPIDNYVIKLRFI